MKKHIFSLFVLLALVLPMLGMEAAAEIVDSGTCGENLTWVLDSEGTLTISGTGDMDSFGVASEAPWANQRESVNAVVIEMGVTSISDFAFNAYSNLTSVTIPEGLTSIGYIAFSHCYNLTNINIPEGVTNIGTGVFNGCSSLTGMTIPKSVTSIGDLAFNACSSLACVTISEEVASIGSFAFGSCSSLTGIYVDEKNPNYSSDEYGVLFNKDKTVLIQAPGALEGSYSVPQSVTSIEEQAFSGCSSLISVTIPESVASIGSYTFSNCSSLSEISVDAQNPNYSSDECGVLFNGDKTVLIQAPGALEGSYSVPQSVTSIEEQAFSGCSSLISVTIPEGVSSITYAAFRDCSSLISVTIPESVTSIGLDAFQNCSSLTGVTIPESVTRIGDWAFNNCNSLTSITIPDGVTSIGYDTFYNCSSLTSVTIPEGVTSIGSSAFKGCSSLTDVYIANIAAWLNISFEYSDANPLRVNNLGKKLYLNGKLITDLVIPDGVTSIGEYAFYNCSSVASVTIPEGVTSISDYAFSECSSLISVAVPESITSIGYGAFYNCSSLKSITIPDSVTSIGSSAFSGCDSLTDVYITDIAAWLNISFEYSGTNPLLANDLGKRLYLNGKLVTDLVIPEGVTSIGEYAFCYCSSVASVTIPEGVTSISDYAFCYCSSLISVAIPESVTNIGEELFSGCSSLTGIYVDIDNPCYSSDKYGVFFNKDKTVLIQAPGKISGSYQIPQGVTSIHGRAFYDCNNLTDVYISNGVTSIGWGAFMGCNNLTSISIPETVVSIGWSAFSWPEISKLKDVYYGGSEEQWAAINIGMGNDILINANIHYASAPPTEETQPITPPAEEDKPLKNTFTDVFEEDYYYNPVLWAVKENITNGMDATHFAPGDTCTRGQIVTFLWRAKGSPEPKTGYNPFRDVKMTDYFYKAVLWAVENGITSGMSADSFAPGAPCTRGQVATFLWRACGRPASGGNNIFTDIAPGAYYYDAVLWAVEKGITNGMGDGTFAPDAPCTRGQIVTFLYRAMT